MRAMATKIDELSTAIGKVMTTKMTRARSLLVELTMSMKQMRLKMPCIADMGLPRNLHLQP